jgi:hypothetical protein
MTCSRLTGPEQVIHRRFSTGNLDRHSADVAWKRHVPDERRAADQVQLGQFLPRPTPWSLCRYRQGNKPPDVIRERDLVAPHQAAISQGRFRPPIMPTRPTRPRPIGEFKPA